MIMTATYDSIWNGISILEFACGLDKSKGEKPFESMSLYNYANQLKSDTGRSRQHITLKPGEYTIKTQ